MRSCESEDNTSTIRVFDTLSAAVEILPISSWNSQVLSKCSRPVSSSCADLPSCPFYLPLLNTFDLLPFSPSLPVDETAD
eukprot:764255-Hanusia_phi.AAC.1